MKLLVLLPLALMAASCIPPQPYRDQRPPQRQPQRYGEPYNPYAQRDQPPGPETGSFEPLPPTDGQRPPTSRNTRPQAPQGPQIDPYGTDPVPAPAPTPRTDYPTARSTANPNEVISPYTPYNVINVEGFKSGQLAKDPSNQKIFRVP